MTRDEWRPIFGEMVAPFPAELPYRGREKARQELALSYLEHLKIFSAAEVRRAIDKLVPQSEKIPTVSAIAGEIRGERRRADSAARDDCEYCHGDRFIRVPGPELRVRRCVCRGGRPVE